MAAGVGSVERRLLAAALSCVLLVAGSITFVDGPAATFAHAHLHDMPVFATLTHLSDPVLPLAALGLVAAGIAAAGGWRPGPVARIVLAACLATLLGYALKDQLKLAFGRVWPETWVNGNPSWIRDGDDGFHPFHGGAGWAAFPSGHMSYTTAPMAVLWLTLRSPWRWLALPPVLVVAVGLYGANYHFIGDMIAGIYLGFASAAGAVALLKPGPDAPIEKAAGGAGSSLT